MSDRQHQSPAIGGLATPARAIVCAGGVDTPYLRAGRGEPIVLIAADVEAADVRSMIADLAQRFLVIAASPPVANVATWLTLFMEGLGLSDAHVLHHASTAGIGPGWQP